MPNPKLPIDAVLSEITTSVEQNPFSILQAPPGAGKTTGVPLSLLKSATLAHGKILLLQPRRIAAQQACYRLAEQLGESAGATVGYKIRLAQKTSVQTRLEVITEGVLLRYLQQDPSLDGISLVIFDECHERSINADLALSLILQARELFDCQTKLLFMSASLDTSKLEQLLPDANIITSEGRSFAVEMHYSQQQVKLDKVIDSCTATISQLIDTPPNTELKDILVFLPGQREIRRVQQQLEQRFGFSEQVFLPLYGQLPLEQQEVVLRPDERARQKIILATNIAETSLTIDGIGIVVDSGLMRKATYQAKTATTQLSTQRISQAQALQRSGRAGRLAPGLCYRIWSQEQQQSQAQNPTPEILEADLSDLCLQLYQWGCPELCELSWLDQPNDFSYQKARELLQQLGAIDALELTPIGQWMNQLACPVRIASLLIQGAAFDCVDESSTLAALLEDGDTLGDLDRLQQRKLKPQQKKLVQRYQQQIQRLSNEIQSSAIANQDAQDLFAKLTPEQRLAALLMLSHPDKLGQRASGNKYKLSNGRQGELKQSLNTDYIVALDVISFADAKHDSIFQALAIDKDWIEILFAHAIQTKLVVSWPSDSNSCICSEQKQLGALVLERKDLAIADHSDLCQQACIAFIQAKGLRPIR